MVSLLVSGVTIDATRFVIAVTQIKKFKFRKFVSYDDSIFSKTLGDTCF